MTLGEFLLLAGYFVAAGLLQLLFGNFDPAFFAFPVNVVVAVFAVVALWVLNREYGHGKFITFLASLKVTAFSLVTFALCCLVIAFRPEAGFTSSYVFNASLLLVEVNLFLAVLRYRGRCRFRFLVNHIGIFLMMAGLSLGSTDMAKWKVRLAEGESSDTGYDAAGLPHDLGYELALGDFAAEFHENGVPSSFTASVSIGDTARILKVNSPWNRSWKEDIYLSGYDLSEESVSAVLEIVRQPWKYVVLMGCIMMLFGTVLLIFGGKR